MYQNFDYTGTYLRLKSKRNIEKVKRQKEFTQKCKTERKTCLKKFCVCLKLLKNSWKCKKDSSE